MAEPRYRITFLHPDGVALLTTKDNLTFEQIRAYLGEWANPHFRFHGQEFHVSGFLEDCIKKHTPEPIPVWPGTTNDKPPCALISLEEPEVEPAPESQGYGDWPLGRPSP